MKLRVLKQGHRIFFFLQFVSFSLIDEGKQAIEGNEANVCVNKHGPSGLQLLCLLFFTAPLPRQCRVFWSGNELRHKHSSRQRPGLWMHTWTRTKMVHRHFVLCLVFVFSESDHGLVHRRAVFCGFVHEFPETWFCKC